MTETDDLSVHYLTAQLPYANTRAVTCRRASRPPSTPVGARQADMNAEGGPFWSQAAKRLVPRVRESVTDERFEHIERVAALAQKIALANGFSQQDTERLELAALLHDAARDLDDEEMLAIVSPGNAVEEAHPLAMHGRAGRRLAEEWGVDDEAVLGAIEGHVFGVERGDDIGAALYVADVCEPGRGVNEDVRELAMTDLWAAYAKAVRSKVKYLRDTGKQVHPATLRAFESLS